NGLPVSDRKRRVLVGARGDALLDEHVARNLGHRGEHALVRDPFAPQLLDHPEPRALGGHPDAFARAHHFSIHFASIEIWFASVRSTWSGVIETAPRSSALKSVP